STDDLMAGASTNDGAPSGDGAPGSDGASADALALADAAPIDGGNVADATDDGATTPFCKRATHAFCEDFDDPSFVLPGRWQVGMKAGGTVTADSTTYSSAPRAGNFSLPSTAAESAATLYIGTNITVSRGVVSFDAKVSGPPNDNYNLFDIELPAATGSATYDLNMLVTPTDLRYFEQSGSLFTEWPIRNGVPSGWHHYAIAFDLINHTSSVSLDGNSGTANPLSTGFVPGKLGLGVGIGYARASTGPTTIWVDNVTLDVP
ncbi:MAG: hypothetical protein JWM74_5241, partial [Myxococcaceae bacterium]|nr:hypothetical protein [Myxococcaceae bacterium]